MNPNALVYVDAAEAERLNAILRDLEQQKTTLQKQIKDSKSARQPAKVIRPLEAALKNIEAQITATYSQMPLQYVDVPAAIESIAQEVERKIEYPKLLKSFMERAATDAAWAVESLGDDLFAARHMERKLTALAAAIRTKATTLQQAAEFVAEFKQKLERECLDSGLMNSTNAYSNALELAKFEIMRKYVRWGEIDTVMFEIKWFMDKQEKYEAAVKPAPATNGNGNLGGALVGLEAF